LNNVTIEQCVVTKSAIEYISASSLKNVKIIDPIESQETKYKSSCVRNTII